MLDKDSGIGSVRCPCGSGKMFYACHGAADTAAVVVSRAMEAIEAAPQIAAAPVTRKLDLACGQSPKEGFEGVDIWPGARHVVNLQQYPWPFADASVLELHCSHYIEHIPMGYVHDKGTEWALVGDGGGHAKDELFAFFDECWRILVPDGWLTIQVPCHRSDRAYQDPTHRRFITAQTFAYTNEEWRRLNRLDHYNVNCNFIGDCNPIVDATMNLRHPEVAQAKMQHEWNTIIDWIAKIQKKPRLAPEGRVNP